VAADRRTFTQRASADCTYRLTWPEADVRVTATMTVEVIEDGTAVTIETEAFEGDTLVTRRTWGRHR
jgi:hypothetical protein